MQIHLKGFQRRSLETAFTLVILQGNGFQGMRYIMRDLYAERRNFCKSFCEDVIFLASICYAGQVPQGSMKDLLCETIIVFNH